MKLFDGQFSSSPFLPYCETCFRDFAHQVKATHECRNCGLKTCVLHSKYHVKYVPHHSIVSIVETKPLEMSFEKEEESETISPRGWGNTNEKLQIYETPRENDPPPSLIRIINENLNDKQSDLRPTVDVNRFISKSSPSSRRGDEYYKRSNPKLESSHQQPKIVNSKVRMPSPNPRLNCPHLEKKNLNAQKANELKSQFEQLKGELKDWQYE